MSKDPVEIPRTLPRIAAEAGIYAVLVAAYLLLVLRALGPWLASESRDHRPIYAALCVGLMLGQGFVLELVTTLLLRLFAGRSGKKKR